jgi:hypothetical protein
VIPVACRETDVEHGPARDSYNAKLRLSTVTSAVPTGES